jgi:hypothetical protein
MWLNQNEAIDFLFQRYGIAHSRRIMNAMPPPTRGPDGGRGWDMAGLSSWARQTGFSSQRGVPVAEVFRTDTPPDVAEIIESARTWLESGVRKPR